MTKSTKPQIETECRRCDGCAKSQHHWLDNDTLSLAFKRICKHCSAVGDDCAACDGTGIDPDAPGEVDCQECDGYGIVVLGWFVPLEESA